MKNFKTITVILLMALTMFSCKKEEPKTIMISTEDKEEIEYTEYTGDIAVVSNGKWTIENDKDWLTTIISDGENDSKIDYKCEQNNTPNLRSASLTAKLETGSIDIFSLSQKGHPLFYSGWRRNADEGYYDLYFNDDAAKTGTYKYYYNTAGDYIENNEFVYTLTNDSLKLKFTNNDDYGTWAFGYDFSDSYNELILHTPAEQGGGSETYIKQ